MKIISTDLEGVLIIEPDVHTDLRGYFIETYQQQRFLEQGLEDRFVQDNLSFSEKRVLRGLHYQKKHSQAKLIGVICGEIFDVAVDVRPGSSSFGHWAGVVLSDKNKRQLLIPKGFAHGFCVCSPTAHVLYKCSDYYHPGDEGGIRWNDPDIRIDWPIKDPLLSEKDQRLSFLRDLVPEELPAVDGLS